MKNVYNLISDAFEQMDTRDGIETDYTIKVDAIQEPVVMYRITIKSKNPNAIGSANLILTLDSQNNLLDYQDVNDLFVNDNWDRFCLVIEAQVTIPDPIANLQGYLLYYTSEENEHPSEEDGYEV